MQRRLLVPQNGVVDPRCACQLQHRITEASHVLQVSRSLLRAQRIQCWHDGIGEQQRIAAQELAFPEQGPSRVQPGNDPRLAAFPRCRNHSVNGRLRLDACFVFHDLV